MSLRTVGKSIVEACIRLRSQHDLRIRHGQVLNRSAFDDALEVFQNNGATRRDRTGDLLITNQPLYQLS